MDAADGLFGLRHFPAETRERFPTANEAVRQHYGCTHGGGQKQCKQSNAEHDS
ncbi:hypothetical protein [Pelagerythrobacter aerophilus]